MHIPYAYAEFRCNSMNIESSYKHYTFYGRYDIYLYTATQFVTGKQSFSICKCVLNRDFVINAF